MLTRRAFLARTIGGVTMTYIPANGGGIVPSQFVQASGTQLVLSGRPWRYVGVNCFDLANNGAVYQPNTGRNTFGSPSSGLDALFAAIKADTGATVVRFWAFQSYATRTSDNLRDWTALDLVFARARAAGIKLVPTLENHFQDLTRGGQKDRVGGAQDYTWYSSGYKTAYGSPAYPTSFQQYVTDIATRYAGDPTIAYWCIMNEPEAPTATMSAFVSDIAGRIKAADPNHLIGIGNQGKDEPGNVGPDWGALLALPNIGIGTTHHYRSNRYPLTGELPVSGWYGRGLSVAGASGSINYGNYNNYEKFPLPAYKWVELRGTLVAGSGAVGLYLHPDPASVGDIYIGQITVGPHDAPTQTITFEDGTIKGALQDGSGTLSNSATIALPGRTRSLKLTATANFDNNMVLPIAAADGSEFCVWVYANCAQAATVPGSGLEGKIMQAKAANKPLVVEEIGAEIGTNYDTVPIVRDQQERARVYDRFLAESFGAGVSGVAFWDYENATRSPRDWCITTGDPECAVLLRYANAIK